MNRGEKRVVAAGTLRMEIRRDGDTNRIDLTGELDAGSVDALSAEVQRLGNNGELVLDLSRLEFIDSSGIVLLLEAHRRSETDGGSLRIVRPHGHVAKLIELAGLQHVLPFTD